MGEIDLTIGGDQCYTEENASVGYCASLNLLRPYRVPENTIMRIQWEIIVFSTQTLAKDGFPGGMMSVTKEKFFICGIRSLIVPAPNARRLVFAGLSYLRI